MQLTTFLTAALLATASLAAPASAPASAPAPAQAAVASAKSMMAGGQWTIQAFTRTCNAADTTCAYRFAVSPNDGSPAAKCSYAVSGRPASHAPASGVKCQSQAPQIRFPSSTSAVLRGYVVLTGMVDGRRRLHRQQLVERPVRPRQRLHHLRGRQGRQDRLPGVPRLAAPHRRGREAGTELHAAELAVSEEKRRREGKVERDGRWGQRTSNAFCIHDPF